jgi:homoserine kinase
MAFVDGEVQVRTPATSANLGPGFDALGLALGLHDDVRARIAPHGVQVAVTGQGAGDLPTDETHLVASSAMAAFDRIGARPPGLVIECHNRIPQARGLGSSSAATVAGILLARALVVDGERILPDTEALRLASEIEGHPDNVAPCLLGGFTIAWMDAVTGAGAVRLIPNPAVQPVIFVPEERGLTAHARAALPQTVPHADAAANAGRAALLVHALTADPSLLLLATEDRLHQNYRAAGMPATATLIADLRGSGVAAVVSGAGPSVLAFSVPEGPMIADRLGWHRLSPGCDLVGAAVKRP